MTIKKEKLKYIDTKHKEDGYIIEWEKAQRYYNNLCADGKHFNISKVPLNYIYYNFFSKRNTGKTTTLVLYAIILHLMYGVTSEYIRQYKDDITRTKYSKLFDGIIETGLIEKLTDGKYNNVEIDKTNKNVYLCKIEDGHIVECSDDRFMTLICVEDAMRFKSTYNAPRSVMLIFDEYASNKYISYPVSEWVLFHTWIATIRRSRVSYKIFMLSNTISPYNMYLQELGVTSDVETMREGQYKITQNNLGTTVYNLWLKGSDTDDTFNERERNKALMFHGFDHNNQLKSIYGGDWEIKNYLKLDREEKEKLPIKNVYIKTDGSFIRCEFYIVHDRVILNAVLLPRITIYDDTMIFTDEPTIEEHFYPLSFLPQLIRDCHNNDSVTFNSNMCGLVWDNFINKF